MLRDKTQLLLFLLSSSVVLLISCSILTNEKEDPYKPPCAFCPFDFRATDYEPDWSPNGTIIAYAHSDTLEGKSGIYFINPDGTNIRQWHVGGATPSWSPDGEWIAFEQGGQIFKKTIEGDSLVQLTFSGRNFFPDWTVDSEYILYDSNVDSENGMNFIWRMNADGSEKRRLIFTPSEGETRMPSTTGLENLLIYIGFLSGVNSSEIFSNTYDDNTPKRITNNEVSDLFPKLSPNGQKIVYTSQRAGEKPQIWIIDVDGNNPKQLTTAAGYSNGWSPDGEWIIYTDSRAVNGRLWVMRADGSQKQQLTFD